MLELFGIAKNLSLSSKLQASKQAAKRILDLCEQRPVLRDCLCAISARVCRLCELLSAYCEQRLEQWADELEELAELAAAAEDADGSDQDEPKSARTSTASCELPLSSRYARVIGDVQDAVYRADDRQRGDIPRLAAHRGHSFKMLSDRATATAAAAAAAAASAAVAASVAVAAIAAAAAPPGEAILARTDATGAGAGVEGAYEAEMMEALAACGD